MNKIETDLPKEAEGILNFWFTEIETKSWFNSDPEFDAMLLSRFGDLNERGAKGELDHWMASAPSALALVILLDQMSRNMYRGTAKAFAQDAKALALANQAIENGFDKATDTSARAFFYMPHMHCENLETQYRCIDLITKRLGADSGNLPHANWHKGVIEQFGRFPFRNKVLDRESSAEEAAFLARENVPG